MPVVAGFCLEEPDVQRDVRHLELGARSRWDRTHRVRLRIIRLGRSITVLVWQWSPFMMLIVLAGLQGQAASVLEAARVDGATSCGTFRQLTLPQLRPYLELGTLLGAIYLVQVYDHIEVDDRRLARTRRTSPSTLHSAQSAEACVRLGLGLFDRRRDRLDHHRQHRSAGAVQPAGRRADGAQESRTHSFGREPGRSQPARAGHLDHRADLLLPPLLDGPQRLQRRDRRQRQPQALLRPDIRSIPRGHRRHVRPADLPGSLLNSLWIVSISTILC